MTTTQKRKRITEIQSELGVLQEQVEIETRSCSHQFGHPAYDPRTKQKAAFSHIIPHGSDPEIVYSYYPTQVPRWSRACEKCGLVEFTEKVKHVKHEEAGPDFY